MYVCVCVLECGGAPGFSALHWMFSLCFLWTLLYICCSQIGNVMSRSTINKLSSDRHTSFNSVISLAARWFLFVWFSNGFITLSSRIRTQWLASSLYNIVEVALKKHWQVVKKSLSIICGDIKCFHQHVLLLRTHLQMIMTLFAQQSLAYIRMLAVA